MDVFYHATAVPVAALATGTVIEVHVVVADHVENHLGGLGQGHGAEVHPVHHVLHSALPQPEVQQSMQFWEKVCTGTYL